MCVHEGGGGGGGGLKGTCRNEYLLHDINLVYIHCTSMIALKQLLAHAGLIFNVHGQMT